MDESKKALLKGELQGIKALITAAGSMSSGFSQTTYAVAGPMVTIPAFAMLSNAFKQQSTAIEKLATLVEKVINES